MVVHVAIALEEGTTVTEDVGSVAGVGGERGDEVARDTRLVPKVICVLRLYECLGDSREGRGPRESSGYDGPSGRKASGSAAMGQNRVTDFMAHP